MRSASTHSHGQISRYDLRAGWRQTGPAIVCEYSATTVVPPGWRATLERTGGLVLEHRDA